MSLWLDRGEMAVCLLITDRFALEEGFAAFEKTGKRGALKVLLDIT